MEMDSECYFKNVWATTMEKTHHTNHRTNCNLDPHVRRSYPLLMNCIINMMILQLAKLLDNLRSNNVIHNSAMEG